MFRKFVMNGGERDEEIKGINVPPVIERKEIDRGRAGSVWLKWLSEGDKI